MSEIVKPSTEPPILIREEQLNDRELVRQVNTSAFGGPAEAELVRQLKLDGEVIVSLVAIDHEQLVGHVLFSELTVTAAGNSIAAAALAPLAVLPEFQNRGTGAQLVQQGIQACRDAGVDIILVVGDPGYYRRFGFSAELAAKLTSPYSGEAFMALELLPGALNCNEAIVGYPDAFSRMS